MKTQISRKSHDPSKRYTGVYQQQGRMITDADWNELQDIVKERLEDALRDIVGDGVPGSGGLQITSDLKIIPGRVYAGGAAGRLPMAVQDAWFEYNGENGQPDFPGAPGPLEDGDILYADVWEREVTYLEDPKLLDPGLGNADTCTRTQMLAQVKRFPAVAHRATGLLGEYYQYEYENQTPELGKSKTTLKLTRIDSNIDFIWSGPPGRGGSPDPSILPDNFIICWTGYISPPAAGKYIFYTRSDDGVRLWIDNKLIIDDWKYHGAHQDIQNNVGDYKDKPIQLNGGSLYAIRLEYFEGGGGSSVQLYWSNDAGVGKQIIPQSQLYPPFERWVPAVGDALLTLAHVPGGSTRDNPDATEVDPEERTGNYVFRLEVHDVVGPPHAPTSITLKWSSENAAEAYAITHEPDGYPDGFEDARYVYEFYSRRSESHLGAHFAHGDPAKPFPERGSFPQFSPRVVPTHPFDFVRRWDGYCKLRINGTAPEGFDHGMDLTQTPDHSGATVENGVLTLQLAALKLELTIAGSTFLAGDYWLVAVRETDNTTHPIVKRATPVGVVHHYVTLGTVMIGSGDTLRFEPVKRRAFPTLADLASVEPSNSGALMIGADAIKLPSDNLEIPTGTVRSQLEMLLKQTADVLKKLKEHATGSSPDPHGQRYALAGHTHDHRYLSRVEVWRGILQPGADPFPLWELTEKPELITVAYNEVDQSALKPEMYVIGPYTNKLLVWMEKQYRVGTIDVIDKYVVKVKNTSSVILYVFVEVFTQL